MNLDKQHLSEALRAPEVSKEYVLLHRDLKTAITELGRHVERGQWSSQSKPDAWRSFQGSSRNYDFRIEGRDESDCQVFLQGRTREGRAVFTRETTLADCSSDPSGKTRGTPKREMVKAFFQTLCNRYPENSSLEGLWGPSRDGESRAGFLF